MCCSLIFLFYRAQMSAEVNVKVLQEPIQTWEDVLNSQFDVIMHLGN